MEFYAYKIMMVYFLDAWRKGMLRKSRLRSMTDPQKDITMGILLQKKYSRKDTTGLHYLKMLMQWKEIPAVPNLSQKRKESCFPLSSYHHRMPLPIVGVGIIGEINPKSSQLHKYILTTTDYFTRWSEEIPLKTINENHVISFLESHIITRFGIIDFLVFDNSKYFSSLKLTEFSLKKNIKVKYSTNYYPQGNGLAKSTNKNLIKILKKTVNDNQRNWHLSLQNVIWDDRVTPKSSIGNSPFFLV
jgi:hypothetical protein